ncbi:hypothetical protein JHK82_032008 [Glycine max]|uniref:BHLH domain-containing protein n=1 Tax=Glycine max TaxID=3847 RepID=I1LME2_SOYBN|nr:putative transcription factor bHLH086 [Glycine max]KAG4995278.1 hypothetical protein JHK86_032105 [Glycine max]KAG5125271.1 hypothetical protein JHK82_032008 [Glycine max]KAG5146697.1 hypothetical protein JHK84_032240 [Glycine max]KAH1160235.1 hypothetical protein GYH30_031828 [Glycine max]KRH30960.1 hypothetical protein GLYMA_11G217700v4 [Glycine max]|eukprot:XP_025980080.1 putative transcription factor bHLH086 [Glycine max]
MALAKDQRIPRDSSMSSKVQNCVFSETSVEVTSMTVHRVNEYHKSVLEDQEDGSPTTNGLSNDSAITHSPPLCGSVKGYAYKGTNYQLEEAEPLINFKGYSNLMQGGGSLLSFQQNKMVPNNCYMKENGQKEVCVWENNLHQGRDHWNQTSPRNTRDMRLVENANCFQTSSGYISIVNNAKEKQHGQSSSGLLYPAPTIPNASSLHKLGAQESVLQKRPFMGESMKAAKKQCSIESKTTKHNSSPSKDPQSVAAKNRRERISERLKILQELVPNGSKVDLVTMLEKAISYVKFLQLQVKVLATDEFWPVQGGKPPDISQVKEVIDTILSSQKERSSSSK